MISLVLYRWHVALLLYVSFVVTLLAFKPPLMFTSTGTPKKFGSKIDETTSIFAPSIAFPVLAFICYFIACAIEVILT